MGRNFRLALLFLGSGQAIFSAEQWLRINSPNFELYTTAGEKKGREAILYFEQVRGLFQRLAKSGTSGPATPVRIIAFDSEKGYKPYRISDFATAYYLGARERDYIVMKSVAPENYPVAIHEYFHLIAKHSGLPLPIWLNEGLAEVYSTLKPYGKQVRMGDIIPGRFLEMRSSKWLSLDTLLSVEHDSPYYNEKNKAGIFYSESWALSHMLLLSDEYWRKFPDFLALLKTDSSPGAALDKVYGKSLDEVTHDLERYLRGTRFNGAYFDVKLEKAAEAPDVRPATAVESGMALAELLAITRKKDEANAAYQKLAQDNPKDPEVELAWARVAWINQEPDAIKRHFERAIALGTTNGKVYFDYAMMTRDGGVEF